MVLSQQVADLTCQVADLTTKLAAGSFMIGAGQSINGTACDPDVPMLTDGQAAERLNKVKARKW